MELGRWAWRQLTSMRTALLLLLLLALAAVPGSIVPQTAVDDFAAARWKQAHPTLTPIYERLGLFQVYGSRVVHRGLRAADGLAGRLHRPAARGLLPCAARPSAPGPAAAGADALAPGAGATR